MRRHDLVLIDHVARRAIRGARGITDLGVLEPRGPEQVRCEVLPVRHPADALDDRSEDRIAAVRVLELAPRGELEWQGPERRQQVVHRDGVGAMLHQRLEAGVARDPRGVREQLVNRDVLGRSWIVGQMLGHGVLDGQLAGLLELQDRRRGELLGHRADAERGVRGRDAVRFAIREPEAVPVQHLIVLHDQHVAAQRADRRSAPDARQVRRQLRVQVRDIDPVIADRQLRRRRGGRRRRRDRRATTTCDERHGEPAKHAARYHLERGVVSTGRSGEVRTASVTLGRRNRANPGRPWQPAARERRNASCL